MLTNTRRNSIDINVVIIRIFNNIIINCRTALRILQYILLPRSSIKYILTLVTLLHSYRTCPEFFLLVNLVLLTRFILFHSFYVRLTSHCRNSSLLLRFSLARFPHKMRSRICMHSYYTYVHTEGDAKKSLKRLSHINSHELRLIVITMNNDAYTTVCKTQKARKDTRKGYNGVIENKFC